VQSTIGFDLLSFYHYMAKLAQAVPAHQAYYLSTSTGKDRIF
jgi:hypothetical protein